MIIDDPNDLDDFERRQRFDEIAAEFGRSIAAWECAPWVSEVELLARDGVRCPDPDEVAGWSDDDVNALLWKLIERLAARNCFLSRTDHLSDRELYLDLYDDVMHQPVKDYAAVLDPDELTRPGAWVQHVDLFDLGNCVGDAQLREYAALFLPDDDRERTWIAKELDDKSVPLPPFRGAPHDRDRFLPRSADDRARESGVPDPHEPFDNGGPPASRDDDDDDPIPF